MKSYLLAFFATDIEMMTSNDWLGVSLSVVTFIAMSISYIKIFHPDNKEAIEVHRYHLIDNDRDVPSSTHSVRIREL